MQSILASRTGVAGFLVVVCVWVPDVRPLGLFARMHMDKSSKSRKKRLASRTPSSSHPRPTVLTRDRANIHGRVAGLATHRIGAFPDGSHGFRRTSAEVGLWLLPCSILHPCLRDYISLWSILVESWVWSGLIGLGSHDPSMHCRAHREIWGVVDIGGSGRRVELAISSKD